MVDRVQVSYFSLYPGRSRLNAIVSLAEQLTGKSRNPISVDRTPSALFAAPPTRPSTATTTETLLPVSCKTTLPNVSERIRKLNNYSKLK